MRRYELTDSQFNKVEHILPGRNKMSVVSGFTQKYNVKTLVYYEQHNNAESAIYREKQLKKWKRDWKVKLIEESNPTWRDLYNDIV